MRRFLPNTTALLLLLQTAAYPLDFSLGGKLGLNLATISGDVEDEFLHYAGGIYAAIHTDLAFTPWLSLQADPAYTMKGCRWVYERENDNGDMVTAEDASRVSYLELPLNLTFTMPRPWRVKPYLYAGPAVAFFVGAHKYVSIDHTSVYSGVKNEAASNVDFGIDWGGGVALELGKGECLLDVRYTLGLLSVDANIDDDVRNRVLTLSLGYRWSLGKGAR